MVSYKTKEDFKLLALTVVTVAYERGAHLQEVPNYDELVVATRGGCNQRFDCTVIILFTFQKYCQHLFQGHCYWKRCPAEGSRW